MTRDEILKALSIVKAGYPNFYKGTDDIKNAVALWEMMFADDDNNLVLMAIKMHLSTNKFPPTIADIRECMAKATTQEVNSEDAWGKVCRAIRMYGYANKEKAIEYLGDELGGFTEKFGWRDLCMSENQMADRAHFIKLWDARSKNNQKTAMLTSDVKEKMQVLSNNTKMIGGD